ncbi:MAG: glycosyltransferase family 4 protein [Acinetobacter sp.]
MEKVSQKICFLIGNLNLSGGTERVTTLLANALAAQGQAVCILNLSQGERPFFPLHAKVENHRLYDHAVSMKTHALATIWKIRKFVQHHKIKHLIVVDSISCIFTVPALFGLNVHHICWEHFNFEIDLGVALRRVGRRWAARYADVVVTLTQRDRQLWLQGITGIRAEIRCIANPCPFAVAQNLPAQSCKTVLAVGRLRPEKGFDLLLAAWEKVVQQHSDWRLRIVGSGDQEYALKQQAELLGISSSIDWFDATSDIAVHYAQASVYCLSSRFEGFGMVLLEALSFGLPIVAFDCPVGPRQILNESNNVLIEAEQVDALAQGLLQFMHLTPERYHSIASENQQLAQQFSINTITTQWLDVLQIRD